MKELSRFTAIRERNHGWKFLIKTERIERHSGGE